MGCVINLDGYSDIGTYQISLSVLNNNITYLDSFEVEHISKEIKKFIAGSAIIANIFRIQAYDSVMCEYLCKGFIDFMLKGKSLTEFNNLFSPDIFKNIDDIILSYFKNG